MNISGNHFSSSNSFEPLTGISPSKIDFEADNLFDQLPHIRNGCGFDYQRALYMITQNPTCDRPGVETPRKPLDRNAKRSIRKTLKLSPVVKTTAMTTNGTTSDNEIDRERLREEQEYVEQKYYTLLKLAKEKATYQRDKTLRGFLTVFKLDLEKLRQLVNESPAVPEDAAAKALLITFLDQAEEQESET